MSGTIQSELLRSKSKLLSFIFSIVPQEGEHGPWGDGELGHAGNWEQLYLKCGVHTHQNSS